MKLCKKHNALHKADRSCYLCEVISRAMAEQSEQNLKDMEYSELMSSLKIERFF